MELVNFRSHYMWANCYVMLLCSLLLDYTYKQHRMIITKNYIKLHNLFSLIGIATRYGLNGPGIESW